MSDTIEFGWNVRCSQEDCCREFAVPYRQIGRVILFGDNEAQVYAQLPKIPDCERGTCDQIAATSVTSDGLAISVLLGQVPEYRVEHI